MTAVIFDCDGTLVDSEPLAWSAWRRVLAEHGYALTDADIAACTGIPYDGTYAYFAERVALSGPEALWRAYSSELYGLLDTSLEPFPDAVGAARELRARGVPVAVASSSRRERLGRTLRSAGLADAFDAVVAGDEVTNGKPAPDMFLVAAERLGAAPASCVAVEDSPPGVAAARAAGMATLAICRVPGTEATLSAADRVVDALSADVILATAR